MVVNTMGTLRQECWQSAAKQIAKLGGLTRKDLSKEVILEVRLE